MQSSVAGPEYVAKKKCHRRDRLLGEIEVLTPWAALIIGGTRVICSAFP